MSNAEEFDWGEFTPAVIVKAVAGGDISKKEITSAEMYDPKQPMPIEEPSSVSRHFLDIEDQGSLRRKVSELGAWYQETAEKKRDMRIYKILTLVPAENTAKEVYDKAKNGLYLEAKLANEKATEKMATTLAEQSETLIPLAAEVLKASQANDIASVEIELLERTCHAIDIDLAAIKILLNDVTEDIRRA